MPSTASLLTTHLPLLSHLIPCTPLDATFLHGCLHLLYCDLPLGPALEAQLSAEPFVKHVEPGRFIFHFEVDSDHLPGHRLAGHIQLVPMAVLPAAPVPLAPAHQLQLRAICGHLGDILSARQLRTTFASGH
ncbi:hypothetical protein BD324DRAFT_653879 [Kockovaella imperatae]|uniref:Uncharacterized protein n=1 Tax=Kockovaella imperatae TaxID=4999 RepID=A0A1Y1U725_9TREE|nr:hypothetical protein BD324DRAFT_653879 [Kockovaella imperatae]ORX33830.1 hypothetical protein BD324DRAFT_653879 [Kockovaella imperatae]